MNNCPKCGINLKTRTNRCPLCHNKIEINNDYSIYPKIRPRYRFPILLKRILLLTSLCGIIFSLIINYLISKKLSWSIFVILGIASFLITFSLGMKKRHSFTKLLFAEVISIITLSITWDYFTGFHKWSLIYVLPLICISYTLTFLIFRIFTNINKDFVIYTYLNSLIGLIPLYFIIKRNINPLWPSYVSAFTSIFALLFLLVFNHHTIENELERRLHI